MMLCHVIRKLSVVSLHGSQSKSHKYTRSNISSQICFTIATSRQYQQEKVFLFALSHSGVEEERGRKESVKEEEGKIAFLAPTVAKIV